MKQISGSASAIVPASPRECYELLAAVDRYRDWIGRLIRELEVLQEEPLQLRAVIYVKQSPFMKTFELCVGVRTEPGSVVYIDRIPNEPDDPEALELRWGVEREGSGTRVSLDFSAVASFLPRLLPIGGVGKLIAETLLESAAKALGS